MDHGGRYALLIIDPGSTVEGAVPKLQSLYGLTPAEAEIGLRIADGVRPQWIADERGVSVETVRSQIKALSAKLGCTRQSRSEERRVGKECVCQWRSRGSADTEKKT